MRCAMHAAFVEKLFRNCYIIFHESHSGTSVSRVAAPVQVFSRHSRVNFRTVVRTNAVLFCKKKLHKKYIVVLCIVTSCKARFHAAHFFSITGSYFSDLQLSKFKYLGVDNSPRKKTHMILEYCLVKLNLHLN